MFVGVTGVGVLVGTTGVFVGVGPVVGVFVGVTGVGVLVAVGGLVGVDVGEGDVDILNAPIRVTQPEALLEAMYSVVNQKVASSEGSTCMAL